MSEFKLDLAALERMDIDGAVRETAEAAGLDRRDFAKKGLLAGTGIVAGGMALNTFLADAHAQSGSTISTRRKSSANDVRILNFALTLEFLEAEFYTEAVENRAFSDGRFELFARTVARHERRHVSFLRGALSSSAVSRPRFDFGETVTNPAMFNATAQVLEDTGVRAYLGQVANVAQDAVLAAAGTIATVEARHAAWIRFLNGGGEPNAANAAQPAPRTFDSRARQDTILREVGRTNFIQ